MLMYTTQVVSKKKPKTKKQGTTCHFVISSLRVLAPKYEQTASAGTRWERVVSQPYDKNEIAVCQNTIIKSFFKSNTFLR